MSGQKHSVCGRRGSDSSTVSLPQTACSAIFHGFDRHVRDRKPLFSVIFFIIRFPCITVRSSSRF